MLFHAMAIADDTICQLLLYLRQPLDTLTPPYDVDFYIR